MKVIEGFGYEPFEPEGGFEVCPDYVVVFWNKEGALKDAAPLYEDKNHSAYRLIGCSSVEEAISWEKEHANGRLSSTLIPIRGLYDKCEQLFVLHGTYLTEDDRGVKPDFSWALARVDDD